MSDALTEAQLRLEADRRKKFEEYVATLEGADEEGLRDVRDRWPMSEKELLEVVRALTQRGHQNMGTQAFAAGIAALAAFHYVAGALGLNAWQNSIGDMDFLRRRRGFVDGYRITDFRDYLSPGLITRANMPTPFDLMPRLKDHLAMRARTLLAGGKVDDASVLAHLEWLADGQPEGEYSQALRAQWESEPKEE